MLRAEPQHVALFLGRADRADDRLRRAGQRVCARGDVRLGRLGHQRHIGERAGPGLGDLDARINRGHTLNKTVNIGLGVAHFHRAGHADELALGQHGGEHAVDIAALFRRRCVGVDIRQAEGVDIRAPGKGRLGKVLGDLLHRGAILRAVRDHNVETLAGIVTDGGSRVGHFEHVLPNI